MGENPNDYEEQLRNTERGRRIMRNTDRKYQKLRNQHDKLLNELKHMNDDKAENKKRLLLLSWKWASMNGEIQYFPDIMEEIYSFMKGDILPELWMQIINTNVDLACDQACLFYTNVKERLAIYYKEQYEDDFNNSTLEFLGINPDKYLVAFEIRTEKNHLDSLCKILEDWENDLETLENELRQLQRKINPHLE